MIKVKLWPLLGHLEVLTHLTQVLGVRILGKHILSAEPTPQNAQFMSVTMNDTPSTSKTTPPHTSDLPQDTHTMSHHFIFHTNKSFKYYLQLNNMFLNQ